MTTQSHRRNAAFFESSLTIRLDVSDEEAIDLIEDLNAAPAPVQAALYHEAHHFFQAVGSTFGLFLVSLRSNHANEGLRMAGAVQRACGVVHKPLLAWLDGPAAEGAIAPEALEELRTEAKRWRAVDEIAVPIGGTGDGITLEQVLRALKWTSVAAVHAAVSGPVLRRRPSTNLADATAARVQKHVDDALDEVDRDEMEEAARYFIRTWSNLSARTPVRALEKTISPVQAGICISWHSLLEGGARMAELIFLDRVDPASASRQWLYLQSPYTAALQTMNRIFEEHGSPRSTGAIELFFLLDLAANPAIDPSHRLPDQRGAPHGLVDFLPGWRFLQACHAAARLPPLAPDQEIDLDASYRSYGGQICAMLGWEPPWQIADRFVRENRAALEATSDDLFLRTCELRAAHPALLAMFPNHPKAGKVIDGLGLTFGSAESSPHKYYIGRSVDRKVARKQGEDTARIQAKVGIVRYVNQLMNARGPFDSGSDPENIDEELAEVDADVTRRIWEKLAVPVDQLVIDE